LQGPIDYRHFPLPQSSKVLSHEKLNLQKNHFFSCQELRIMRIPPPPRPSLMGHPGEQGKRCPFRMKSNALPAVVTLVYSGDCWKFVCVGRQAAIECGYFRLSRDIFHLAHWILSKTPLLTFLPQVTEWTPHLFYLY